MNFQNSKSIKMTQSAHQGKQIHLGWARIHQRWQKNVPQNQHWTVAFLNLKNIKMLLPKVCARWNRSHRFPGVSHLQELHCKTLGWVSVVQQCKFLTDHLSYIQLVYILLTDSQENTFYHNFQLPRELRLQLSFFQNHFHFIHYRFHRLLNNCQGELQLKYSLIFFKKTL